jgi:hypothetical protein
MKSKRPLGILFVIAATAGILLCLYGIFQTWRIRVSFSQSVDENLALLGETVETTRDGLDVVETVLETTAADLTLVRSSVFTLTLAIQDTNRILGSLEDLTATDLPASIDAAQTSLASAQTSAQLIDNMLATLARVPLLGLGAYQPEVPLNVALGDISTSLDPLKPSLQDISLGLADASTNLGSLADQLEVVSEASAEIDTALRDARTVIAEYRSTLTQLETNVSAAQTAVPGWTRSAAWVVTVLLGVLLFAQIGLFERGQALARAEESPFVPADYYVPPILETDRFRLRMLSVLDVEKDYEAVMETQAHFHDLGLSWPREGFTLAENLADLARHQHEFVEREAFAYTVVSLDESRVLGCVYINPANSRDADASVNLWVRASEMETGLGRELHETVQAWIAAEWPFESAVYPMKYMRF